ncbi:SAM-dependent methyltransferase [Nocardia sp. CDC159]|uniref:SAM-dependent methyltransferase n=1 Tax=Nocardia pulmonis TaxID=2951408 RepID=A0A9X2E8S4_9NOCA|nr:MULTISPECIES: SAM-dependent methyltransferase [Nocardia]MCM6774960.1 SAM-dependent methyltransferase [Nocardia pulmonis]MCM6789891.1 SAM-dependent methyltransferase [Nocardia sp. CDC159]
MGGKLTDEAFEGLMTTPQSARVYGYLLGGKDCFDADRKLGELILQHLPTAGVAALVNRNFMRHTTRWLAREVGVEQFLDIGAGLPQGTNLHQIAQAIRPASRVVYVDRDPIVLAHGRALMTSAPDGGPVVWVDADVRDPAALLDHLRTAGPLNLREPIALSLNAVLHHVTDDAVAEKAVRELVAALAPGSFLVMTHLTADFNPHVVDGLVAACSSEGLPVTPRGREAFARYFTGLELLTPGVVAPHRWWPEDRKTALQHPDSDICAYAAIGQKMRAVPS